ncbi:hypothetical protein PV08_08537 [Exophiala spinifera]|uniref:Metallo-beta-lactamase domain-containing protein n=1 Tax=Exophiala spinifera TaxID=91928 RepID=A0A0D2BQD6_9EURO|nr:uncharacterized protein PV08_08537 [Exophiala spinifera]KIW13349.1 hypothetical protein PV08_08537 [Exophiala spinifera]
MRSGYSTNLAAYIAENVGTLVKFALETCSHNHQMTSSCLPQGETAVKVAILCNAKLSGIPMSRFASPSIRGLEILRDCPSFSFYLEHPSGRRVLFDVGVRKDVSNLSPSLKQRIVDGGWTASVISEVPEILENYGISRQSIECVIWSHWHWDHIGDMSKFPNSTSLVTGPGFSSALLPSFPSRIDSPLLETDYQGRILREIADFETRVGDLPAHDFFGDGSFQLLSTPGHAVGHLAGLARTTTSSGGTDDTFILMGGDCCHHMAMLRPSIAYPLPCEISLSTIPASTKATDGFNRVDYGKGHSKQLLEISDYPNGESAALDVQQAKRSLDELRLLEAQEERVLFVIAHDKSLLDVVELFPNLANDWKRKDWGRKARWAFLDEIQMTF